MFELVDNTRKVQWNQLYNANNDNINIPRLSPSIVTSSRLFTYIQPSNLYPLAHILRIGSLIFSSCTLFTVYPNCIMKRHPTPLWVMIHQSVGGWSKTTQGQAKMSTWNIIIHICTRAFHSFLSFTHCCTDFTIITLRPRPPSHHPSNLTLVYSMPAVSTLLAIWCSSILSTCPNHLNMFWSPLLTKSLSLPPNFSNTSSRKQSLYFSQHFSYPPPPCLCSVQCHCTLSISTSTFASTILADQSTQLLWWETSAVLSANNSWFISNLPTFTLRSSIPFPSTLALNLAPHHPYLHYTTLCEWCHKITSPIWLFQHSQT